MDTAREFDVVIVGAGAAGLATAIFTARRAPELRIAALDGAAKLGAKILVSGGGRCNVTNRVVTQNAYWGGSSNIIKKVLAALPVKETIEFFGQIGVELHEEENGKLFPDSNQARTVLEALLGEATRLNVQMLGGHRVEGVARQGDEFRLTTSGGEVMTKKLVLATGGLSLPKTGSDGGGYELARALGHRIVTTTPALAPLVLEGDFHVPLSGIAQDVELTIRVEGEKPKRLAGAMLWTHFGVSGPVAMDMSRMWHRAAIEGRQATISASLLPGENFEGVEARMIDAASKQPRAQLISILAGIVPARVAGAILRALAIAPHILMAHLSREDRRRLARGLLEWPLPVKDSRGYGYAEATAGGVPLAEIDAATMQSRKCDGLYLVGEILDVDGRIGGFNFQWAWASGFVAAGGIANDKRQMANGEERIAK